MANNQYKAGIVAYLNVLSAETNVLAQRRQSVDIEARILSTNAALAQALGGGYSEPAAGAEQPAATGSAAPKLPAQPAG